ncbi:B12-binding domain-containing protein [Pseudonocardia sp. N23]|uniref:cobalamin B12-binding domain-containing protein n=1 Tax=Pseudonocardia sp. N23 TaxID=1987376 RepID=UPI000BFE8C8F|nr:cobalamin-dependent protein [Pseudonocardia sp. N23]GAY07433.1 B12 binding domain protein [Pseudonocardia sp. N23]
MTAPPTLPTRLESVAPEFFDALGRADEWRACELAVGLLGDGVHPADVLVGLVGAAARRIGALWEAGEWSVAQEHAATCVNERVVAAVGARIPAGGARGSVVVGCLDGEWHALPARIVSEVLRANGWAVTFLGASVPAEHLASYLHQYGPDVVALSCALPIHLPAAHRTIVAAQRTGTPVLAGGPGFGADGRWARRLGVDAWAPGPVEAVAVLDQQPWRGAAPPVATITAASAEYAGLTERRGALVGAAVDALEGFSPFAGPPGNPLGSDPVQDAGQVVDFLGAAVYLSDDGLFADYLHWLGSALGARDISTGGLHAVLGELAAGLHDFPFALSCLRQGREQLRPGFTNGGGER